MQDEQFALFVDGKPEPPGPGAGFGWGRAGGPAVTATATRILSREVPATSLAAYVDRFEAEVLRVLPRAWRITSDEIRGWMGSGNI